MKASTNSNNRRSADPNHISARPTTASIQLRRSLRLKGMLHIVLKCSKNSSEVVVRQRNRANMSAFLAEYEANLQIDFEKAKSYMILFFQNIRAKRVFLLGILCVPNYYLYFCRHNT